MKTGKLFNRSFIVRKRKDKTRYELSSGECFYNVQFYKFGLYIEKGKPSRQVGFKSIKDFYAFTTVRKLVHNTVVSK